jgi:hypothetical protein
MLRATPAVLIANVIVANPGGGKGRDAVLTIRWKASWSPRTPTKATHAALRVRLLAAPVWLQHPHDTDMP